MKRQSSEETYAPENLFFALVYNTPGVPVAAGVLFPFFGILITTRV